MPLPMRGRGLKQDSMWYAPLVVESPPMRGRGLKLKKCFKGNGNFTCRPPMRGRGLKQNPCEGQEMPLGRPPCGGVD